MSDEDIIFTGKERKDNIHALLKNGADPLKLSLRKWEYIVNRLYEELSVEERYNLANYARSCHTCACCVSFWSDIDEEACVDCPIYKAGYGCLEEDSVYNNAIKALYSAKAGEDTQLCEKFLYILRNIYKQSKES